MPTSRSVLFAVAAASFTLVGAALYLQHVEQMLPCPLCVIQRYLYLAVGLFALLGAVAGKARAGAALGLLAALGGLGVVARHLYVQANPGFSCGIDPVATALNNLPTASAMPWLFSADGMCSAADVLFGVTIPAWSAAGFLALTASLVWVLSRRSR